MTGETPVPDEVATGHSGYARRQRLTLIVAALCAVLAVGGLLASTLVRSPAQLAAERRAPEPSQLTAKVERRVLVSTVVTRGSVNAETQLEMTPLSSAQGAATPVVTAVRTAVGKAVRSGEVLLEVSGRPLVALPGAVPAYRDLKPGDEGRDVVALQAALRSLGHYRGGDRTGLFGPATKTAVRRLYTAIGYDAATTGGPGGAEEREALRAAQDAVDAAQREVTNMNRRIAAAQGQPTPPGEEPLAVQLKYLKQALTKAKRAQSELIARTGPMMPQTEVAFLPAFPARVAQLSAKPGDPVEAPLITLATGKLTVLAKAQPGQLGLLKAGMKVQIASETLGQEVAGTIASVGAVTTDAAPSTPGGDGQPAQGEQAQGPPYVPVVVRPATALGNAWAGQDVRLTITSAQTSGPVLVVPLSAVSSAADGKTTVSRVGSDQAVRRVEVRAGVSGDGFVEVTPESGALADGDLVVVGK